MTFASQTSVTEERSRAEIERLLRKYGASRFGTMTDFDSRKAVVQFIWSGIAVQMEIALPDPKDARFRMTPARRRVRSVQAQAEEYEAEVRRKWRCLALAIKAKLVAVDDGIATFESEFMPYMVAADGVTLGQKLLPAIAAARQSGNGLPARIGFTPGES